MPRIDEHYQPANGSYHCNKCHRVFDNSFYLGNHLDKSSNHCWCGRCERDFVNKNVFVAHYKDSPRHWLCEIYYDDSCDFDGES